MGIIEIKYKDYKAKINISEGANCISLTNSKYNADILRTPDYSKSLDNPYVYGMPILYPANRISVGMFEFEGRVYSFPINEPETNCHLHGVLHCTPFKMLENGESFVKCVFNSKYFGFPHELCIEICYELSDCGLTQTVKIINLSQQNIPNLLGFHTTFNLPFIKASRLSNIEVFANVYDEIERNSVYLPTGKILPDDEITTDFKNGLFSPYKKSISRHYHGNGNIELYDKPSGIKVVYETDEKYKYRLFYKGINDSFICLEPMNCMVNCFNSPFERNLANFDYIESNSSKTYVSKIYIEKI